MANLVADCSVYKVTHSGFHNVTHCDINTHDVSLLGSILIWLLKVGCNKMDTFGPKFLNQVAALARH